MNKAPKYAAPEICVSESDGGFVIFDPNTGEVFVSNKIGARIWTGLSAGLTTDEISNDLSDRFGTSRERAKHDVDVFVTELVRRRLLVRRPP